MSIEGLDFVLNKQEVVPTVSAQDLVTRAERVEQDYRRHVRTYVPISRAAEGDEGGLNVDEFVRRTIRGVKDAKALRGHLTAEFGYGKTTTALYLWQEAERANLVAVPPFQMLQLPDLITATHGWVRHRLSVQNPSLVPKLDDLYADLTGRSLAREASAQNVPIHVLENYFREGRFVLELQAHEYVNYFERATDFVTQSGYDGLLVMPDEIQQYIQPAILRSNDPIAPFFNLLQAITTRSGHLKFGLLIVVPLKELGTIRETRGRGDVIDRMNDVKLDLTTVYDVDFATRLWGQLAAEFGFRNLTQEIIAPEALQALGEIAARNDLSNGPRTVINVFRRVVERYRSSSHSQAAYTPIDLIDDMLGGVINFTGANEIQNITRRVLQSAIVHREPARFERAVKLAAAFPTNGVPYTVQQTYAVADALDELSRQALGETVISVGPIDQRGYTLFGLQVGSQQSDWLAQTIRDFRRAYNEIHDSARDRAVQVFSHLLRSRVFTGWSLVDERASTFTANHSLILEGDFSAFAGRFPKRRVHVRILWEDEDIKDADLDGDIAIEFQLSLHAQFAHDPQRRRTFAAETELNFEEHRVRIPLNLFYVRPEGIPPQVLNGLKGVWSPYDLSPLVLMNIYALLDEKRAAKQIPPEVDGPISASFQPTLLDTILRDLFNPEVGANLDGVSQARIVEVAAQKLLEARYNDTYHTLMAPSNWKSTLSKYANALSRLENIYQRRGEVDVEGTKNDIASKFTYTNSTLDTFIANYPTLLTISQRWSGRDGKGAVRFSLHDLETRILRWLRESPKTERVKLGSKSVEVHQITNAEAYHKARDLGYRDDEVAQIIDLLKARGLVEVYRDYQLRETASPTVDLDEIAYQLKDLEGSLAELLSAFPTTGQLKEIEAHASNWRKALDQQRSLETPDAKLLTSLGNTVRVRQNDLANFVSDKRADLMRRLNTLRQSVAPVNPQHVQSLEKQIVGSVSFVDQINALRRAVLTQAQKAKSNVDSLVTNMEKTTGALHVEDISVPALARCAAEIDAYEQELKNARTLTSTFETNYRDLGSWQQLVEHGSALLNELQQMNRLTGAQTETFDKLSRDISARISSAANKLDVIQDHAIYVPDFRTLRDEVQSIRNQAENSFTDLQRRYFDALTTHVQYRREQLGRPISYNPGNPEEAYRLLYERAQELTLNAVRQLDKRFREYANAAKTILTTPLFHTLPTEHKERTSANAQAIIRTATEATDKVDGLLRDATGIAAVQDFPPDGSGAFGAIIAAIAALIQQAATLKEQSAELEEWLRSMELTAEETILLEALSPPDSEQSVDLVEWRAAASLTESEFWSAFRSLYEKRRVRSFISRVRNQLE